MHRVVVRPVEGVHRVAAGLKGPVVHHGALDQGVHPDELAHAVGERAARLARVGGVGAEEAVADLGRQPLHGHLEDAVLRRRRRLLLLVVRPDQAIGGQREPRGAGGGVGADGLGRHVSHAPLEQLAHRTLLLAKGRVRVRLQLREGVAEVGVVGVGQRHAERVGEREDLGQDEEQRGGAARLEDELGRIHEER